MSIDFDSNVGKEDAEQNIAPAEEDDVFPPIMEHALPAIFFRQMQGRVVLQDAVVVTSALYIFF